MDAFRSRDPRVAFDEFVCPRCRFPVSVPRGEKPRWPSCPEDGWPLVARETFLRSDGDPILGVELAGGFVPVAVAGAGSTSVVYRARFARGDAAIKVMRIDGVRGERVADAWQREVAALEGPLRGIVRLLDSGRIVHPAAFFIALEWLEGAAPHDEPYAEREAVRVAARVAEALSTLHAAGTVHCDLAPHNVMLHGELVTLFDLGSSRAEGSRGPAFAGWSEGEGEEDDVFDATPAYASPERVRGERLDRRSDTYSLGCLLVRLLTGRAPLSGSAEAVARRHAADAPIDLAAPPHASEDVWALASRLLAKDPRHRPAHPEADLRALERQLAGETG